MTSDLQSSTPKATCGRLQFSLWTLLCLPVIMAVFFGLGKILAARDGVLTGWREAWFALGLVIVVASFWKRRWLFLSIGALVMVANIPGLEVPTSAITPDNMHMMKRRVLRYAHIHDRLPASVAELPVIKGYDNDTLDAWGREIRYEIEGGVVTLTSYGRDGVQGGVGPDADIVAVFRAKDDKGNWNRELVDWLRDPHKRPTSDKRQSPASPDQPPTDKPPTPATRTGPSGTS